MGSKQKSIGLEAWKKEYYPTSASKCKTQFEAVEHSMRKWEGLLKKNLKRFGLLKDGRRILEIPRVDGGIFNVDVETCALCCVSKYTRYGCGRCPLYDVRGGVECDRPGDCDRSQISPHFEFVKYGNASSMLRWLRKTKKALTDGRVNAVVRKNVG